VYRSHTLNTPLSMALISFIKIQEMTLEVAGFSLASRWSRRSPGHGISLEVRTEFFVRNVAVLRMYVLIRRARSWLRSPLWHLCWPLSLYQYILKRNEKYFGRMPCSRTNYNCWCVQARRVLTCVHNTVVPYTTGNMYQCNHIISTN
jgi:hypothetical protein